MIDKTYKLNEIEYKLIFNYKDAFDKDKTFEKVTDYFNDFDYIVGDWSYGSLRLKGFCKKGNKRLNKQNDYNYINNYIKDKCAYGCKYFVLEKII